MASWSNTSSAPGAARQRSHAQNIGAAVHGQRRTQVSAAVAERMAWTLLDGIAVIRFGASLERAAPFVKGMADRVGTPSATVPALSLKLAAENAAAIHAFLIHAAEIDDSDLRGQLRASAVVLPAVLATAEAVDCSGMDFVQAAALAYTLQGRMGTPLQPRGWMSSGVFGPPAAAAACALLMEQPADSIAAAMALAGSASGGLFQYFYDQSEDKRLIVARAARIAVESARLASLGDAGPARILEGRAGLYAMFAGTAAPATSTLTQELGALEGPLFLRSKFYAASQSIIPTLDGMAEDLPAGFRAADVEAFVVRGDARYTETIGAKIEHCERPATKVGAALNYNFVVSMFLLRKSVMPGDYPAAMADETVQRLAARGRYEGGAPLDELTVEFRMRDGTSHRVRARKPGRQEPAPLDRERRLKKFDALCSDLPGARKQRMRQLCLEVAGAPSMRTWMEQLSAMMKG
jgi:2-methylcitrate dehydratase PrpD